MCVADSGRMIFAVRPHEPLLTGVVVASELRCLDEGYQHFFRETACVRQGSEELKMTIQGRYLGTSHLNIDPKKSFWT